jgi:hypothetical protein
VDRLQSPDGKSCFEQSGELDAAAYIGDCKLSGSAQYFRLARAQWRTPTHCVAPQQKPPVEGSLLVTEPCAPAGDPGQSWFFEITGAQPGQFRTRIHFAGSGLCVSLTRPGPLRQDPLELRPCATTITTDDPQSFWLDASGAIKSGNLFVRWQDPAGALFVQEWSSFSTFFASGALEGANGTALTLLPSLDVVVTELGTLPSSNQIFDVYF